MTKFDREKLIEIVVYILNITEELDYYRIFKILYFAEREHLSKYGMRMVTDNFVALENGPVPTELYDAIKKELRTRDLFNELYKAIAKVDSSDANYFFKALRKPDMDYLSRSEIDCLDISIKENARLTFGELKNKSHDIAWKKAWDSNKRVKNISVKDIAIAGKATNDVLEYLEEHIEVEMALA